MPWFTEYKKSTYILSYIDVCIENNMSIIMWSYIHMSNWRQLFDPLSSHTWPFKHAIFSRLPTWQNWTKLLEVGWGRCPQDAFLCSQKKAAFSIAGTDHTSITSFSVFLSAQSFLHCGAKQVKGTICLVESWRLLRFSPWYGGFSAGMRWTKWNLLIKTCTLWTESLPCDAENWITSPSDCSTIWGKHACTARRHLLVSIESVPKSWEKLDPPVTKRTTRVDLKPSIVQLPWFGIRSRAMAATSHRPPVKSRGRGMTSSFSASLTWLTTKKHGEPVCWSFSVVHNSPEHRRCSVDFRKGIFGWIWVRTTWILDIVNLGWLQISTQIQMRKAPGLPDVQLNFLGTFRNQLCHVLSYFPCWMTNAQVSGWKPGVVFPMLKGLCEHKTLAGCCFSVLFTKLFLKTTLHNWLAHGVAVDFPQLACRRQSRSSNCPKGTTGGTGHHKGLASADIETWKKMVLLEVTCYFRYLSGKDRNGWFQNRICENWSYLVILSNGYTFMYRLFSINFWSTLTLDDCSNHQDSGVHQAWFTSNDSTTVAKMTSLDILQGTKKMCFSCDKLQAAVISPRRLVQTSLQLTLFRLRHGNHGIGKEH